MNIRSIIEQKKKNEELEPKSSGGYDNEDIWFKFTEGNHRVRLLKDGAFIVRDHWVAPSKFTPIELFPASAFEGDNALKKSIRCADFDIDTTMLKSEKECLICKLRKAVNNVLYDSKTSFSAKEKEYLTNVAKACAPQERYFFLGIDRDNPEVAPGKKGYKIIEFPKGLYKLFQDAYMDSDGENSLFNCDDDEQGFDIIISKKKDGSKWIYAVKFAMNGRSVAMTPLTDEERDYKMPDLKKIFSKIPDQSIIYDALKSEFQDFLSDEVTAGLKPTENGETAADADDNESIPF